MAYPGLSARLRYLNDAAHLLASTAPATSKYIMSQCNSIMFDSDLGQSESQKRKVCGACGTIMILGWDGTLEVESQKTRRRERGGVEKCSKVEPTKVVTYTCGSCGRKTRQGLSSARHPSTPLAAPSANASSKKRAKTRKQGGLLAIMAKHKASEYRGSGFGLDLMDLMKRP